MDKSPLRVERITKVIRHEMYGPVGEGVDAKHWNFLYSVFLVDFKKVKSRSPEFDNDWWIEPTDDGIAICYIYEQSVEA